jgi:hypothetical protein
MARMVAVLLFVSAALFAVGSAVERNQKGEHADASAAPSERHSEQGESRGARSSEGGAETAGEETGGGGESHSESEDLLGVNPEATALVVVAVAASIFLAFAVWLRPQPLVLVAVILLGLAFAALDAREFVHQVNESRAGIAVIAAALAVLHAGVAALAAALLRHSALRAAAS